MARLDDLTRGVTVKGILPDGPVTVVDVQWHGSVAIELTYKDVAGHLGNELLYRDRELKPEVTRQQMEEEQRPAPPLPPLNPPLPPEQPGGGIYPPPQAGIGTVIRELVLSGPVAAPALPRRFYGAVSLDAIRTGRDTAQIADEVIQHLTKLLGAKVEITLEIQAEIPDGVPEQVVRTVTENCRTLRFKSYSFEEA